MLEKAQVHMIPTDKSSNLWLGLLTNTLHYESIHTSGNHSQAQHLYFTTDEEIKEGDKVLYTGGQLGFPDGVYTVLDNVKERMSIPSAGGFGIHHHISTEKLENGKTHTKGAYLKIGYNIQMGDSLGKIVATTNPELWKLVCSNSEHTRSGVICDCSWDKRSTNGIGKIGLDFVEAYVKAYNEGNPIKEVMLECIHQCKNGHFMSNKGVCSYPHCHELHYPVLKLRSNGTVIIHPVVEKLYKRSELLNACYAFKAFNDEIRTNGRSESSSEWFDKHYPNS